MRIFNIHTNRKQAFETIYNQCFDRLYAYALVITQNPTLAEDSVSEVFCRLWASQKDLTEIKDLTAYLYASVKHQAIRAVSLNPQSFDNSQYQHTKAAIEGVNPEELMIGKELASFVEEVIDSLPPKCQLVYRMVREKDLKYHEVADELGISANTVRNHMAAALGTLRKSLEQRLGRASVIRMVRVLKALAVMLASLTLLA